MNAVKCQWICCPDSRFPIGGMDLERRYICEDDTSEYSILLHGQENLHKAHYEIHT